MKIVKDYPPNIAAIREKFDLRGKNVVFTYGDKLYVPSGAGIPDNLMKHEETHTKQQGKDVEGWWDRYLVDNQFRLEQEVEAYQAQYKYVVENGASRQVKRDFLQYIARDLSGPIYGHVVSFEQAKQLITN